jgi:hypothetical protein
MTVAARQLSLWKSKRQRGVKPKPAPEFPVHCAIADTLYRWIAPGWLFWHTPNGGERTKRIDPRTGRRYSPEGQRLKRMGLRDGVSDFLLIGPPAAQLHAYELKREGETPTEEQLQFGQDVLNAGGKFAWGDTYEHAIAQMQAWGALPSTLRVL